MKVIYDIAGLASSRLVCRLGSQYGRDEIFDKFFRRTIRYRPSEVTKTKRDDSIDLSKNKGRNRTKDETDDIIGLSQETCLTNVETVAIP